MPMYDYQCQSCEKQEEHFTHEIDKQTWVCACGGEMIRVWVQGNANNVIGDEIDVTIKHSLCWPDGTPRRFRSRKDLRVAEIRKGVTNYVVHDPAGTGNKTKHTSRWI